LIIEKEKERENDRCAILSIDKHIKDTYNINETERYNQELFNECRELIKAGFINFIVVILNGCSVQQFNRMAQIATAKGYQTYSIEIHQPLEVCLQYNDSERNKNEISYAIEDLNRFPTPLKFTILDPTSLFVPKTTNMMTEIGESSSISNAAATSQSSNNINDLATNLAQLLQNQNVLKLLQSQMNNQQPSPQPLMTTNIPPPINFMQSPANFTQPRSNNEFYQNVECPIFKPTKVIDYEHEHKQTFEEQLMEFRVFRSIEYNHQDTHNLKEFIRDIDVDKIIEKRKAVALRKKILEYLRNAERPEDTVSNPKYPKNWEVIVIDRPPRRNKRKKKMTAKIKRVLFQKSHEENSWMTTGYKRDEKMDLEEISSDDDMEDNDVKMPPFKKIKIVIPPTKIAFEDKFKNFDKTTPDFNHFNHTRVLDVKELLYMPDRKNRSSYILIILRGASGSGRSHLAQLIKRKESDMGNSSNIRILSIDDYFLEDDDEIDPDERKKNYLEQMQKTLRKTINDNLYNFIIIDAENCDLNSYNQFYQIGLTMGFAVYTIELFQTLDICCRQSKRGNLSDITKSIELLKNNRIPNDHILLIPSELYAEYKCFVNPKLRSTPAQPSSSERESLINAISTKKIFLNENEKRLEFMPQFNFHDRAIVNIEDVMQDNVARKKHDNVAILMRGSGGSGKIELSSVLIEKAKQLDTNSNPFFISIEDYFINSFSNKYEFNSRLVEANMQKFVKKLREILRMRQHKFLIIDGETGDFSHYQQLHELVSSYNYQCYTIEMYQEASICQLQDVYKRPLKEIESVLEDMQLNPTPDDHTLLNASIFYKEQSIEKIENSLSVASSVDRPLKSALKISPNTSSSNIGTIDFPRLKNYYLKKMHKASPQLFYQAKFQQRLKIGDNFVDKFPIAPKDLPEFNWFNQDITEIRELVDEPGRNSRPQKCVVFIRGGLASGKTYLARLIERKEIEKGNKKECKILSIDTFFESECFRATEKPNEYEKYIELSLESKRIDKYMEMLYQAFEKTIKNTQYAFLIVDGDFCNLKFYTKMWDFANSNGYTCFKIELNQKDEICLKYNYHGWNESMILSKNNEMRNIQTPESHELLDPEWLYSEYHYEFRAEGERLIVSDDLVTSDVSDDENSLSNCDDVQHEEDNEDDDDDETMGPLFGKFKMSAAKSKWDDYESPDIDRLDGTKNKSFNHVTMADYLQSDDEWSMRPSTSGKKRVRWADIEEKKEQDRMRKIGFIVGQTDWKRMVDDSDGRSALEKTKYIEPRQKK
jgi:YLP motif-containing protein 1